MQTGNSASPDCFSTCVGLGAESSATTLQWAEPMPVSEDCQFLGSAPGLASSKLMQVSAARADKARQQAKIMRSDLTGGIYGLVGMFPEKRRELSTVGGFRSLDVRVTVFECRIRKKEM